MVNLESLPNWEEKQMFKEYYNIDAYYRQKMEREMKKGSKKALETERTVFNDEEQRRFLLNAVLPILDERALCITWKQFFLRLELQRERERYKEVQVEELKRSMQSGMVSFYSIFLQAPDITISCFWPLRPGSMAQAMKEQAQLREEMAYQYKVGNSEAAAAIQRRLDPDVAM
ncbi:hypothetical protein CK203_031402 [Vitis vinifera]|uniref:Uncharacterized protein n=1 Tax=Vitis vinifera TaxID=29760 RepID=A0A438I8V5_VITVI|nr:hypothetical protein CK203_031402 [Vitis vinifera]